MIRRLRNLHVLLQGRIWLALARFRTNIKIEGTVSVIGWPHVRVTRDAILRLGDGVVLNSSRLGYHTAMHSPVTLIADRPGALIEIGSGCRLNGATIHAQTRVTLGVDVLMAAQSSVFDSNGHILFPASDRLNCRDEPKPVEIGDQVWVALGAVVTPGCCIGVGAIVGANAVASGRIQSHAVVRVLTSALPLDDMS